LKTRKGGLGKNEHPDGLTTFKGNSGKSRGNTKKLFPGGSKTRKGDPGKNGMMKIEMKKNNKKQTCKALTTDAMSKALTRLFQQAAIPFKLSFSIILQLPAFNDGLDVSSSDCNTRRRTFASICPSTSRYVPNIPMFCPSLRNHVYKLPIIMHSKTFIHA